MLLSHLGYSYLSLVFVCSFKLKQGFQPAFTPQKQKWTNPGYGSQSKSSPSQGYSSLYYSPGTKSNAINTKPTTDHQGKGSASQDYSSLYYGPDTKSKGARPVSSGSYKMSQKTPSVSYSNYYSPDVKNYQTGSYKNTGSGRTQNKQPSLAYSNYYSPAEKSNHAPAKSNQPNANRGQNWNSVHKGNMQTGVQPSSYSAPGGKSQQQWNNKNMGSGKGSHSQDYSSLYYAPDTKSNAVDNKQASAYQSQSSPQQGYSSLYYAPDTKSKGSHPVSSGASSYYGGNYNNRLNNPNVKSQQQWANNNQDNDKKSGEQSQSFLNYYSLGKRSMDGILTVSTTTGKPNATSSLGFIAEFFHEHVVGTSSTTTKSDRLFGIGKRNITKRTMGRKRHVAQARLMKRKRKHVEIEVKPEVSTTTANPNATSRLGFIGDFFHNLFVGNSSSSDEHKNVSKRQMELKTQNENGKGEKHLVALTFSIREQQVKATFSDSQNVSQSPGKVEEDAFTTPSMEDMLKKENAMLMDLVKVVSNGVANNKLKSNTGASQIAKAINRNPGHLQPQFQNGNMELVNHPKSFSRRPIEKKHTSEVKRTVPGSKVDTNDEQEGNMTQVEKKHVQKETVTKTVQKPKNSLSGLRFPGGRKYGNQGRKKQKPPILPSVEEHESHKEESKDDVKPPEAESPNDELGGNEMDDVGDDSVEGGADEEVTKDSDVGEDLPNNDDNEIDMVGSEIDGEESMDETDVPKNKNTGTVERVVIEESKKFKSKLTETFEKNAEDTNTPPDNSEDEIADVTEEPLPAGEKKLVDKTAKMMEAISILYKLAGNESKGDVIKRDEKDSVSGNNSIPGNNSISKKDSIPPKDSNAQKDSIPAKDSISDRDSFPLKDSNPQKDSKSGNNSIPEFNSISEKENASLPSGTLTTPNPIIENVSIALASSLPTIDATAKKNRKRKFTMERESNEVTTANGAQGKVSTPWTQIIREATQEDQFTEEMIDPPLVTSGVLYDPADNTENIMDDIVDTTKDGGALQTEFMDRFAYEEPSTIEIENVGDDFTTDTNMDSII